MFDNKYSDLLKDNEHSEVAEAYHKAKADGTNPELVKAVEDLLGKQKESSPTPQTGKGEREVKQQIETFGVPKQDVEPVHNVITQVFDGLKKAGLTAAKTVGEMTEEYISIIEARLNAVEERDK